MNTKNVTLWFLASLIILFGAVALLIACPFLRALAAAVIVAVIFFPAYKIVFRWTGNRPTWSSLAAPLAIDESVGLQCKADRSHGSIRAANVPPRAFMSHVSLQLVLDGDCLLITYSAFAPM